MIWNRNHSLLGLQNSRFFFSKSVKKSMKRGVRVVCARSAQASHARSAQASHARSACEASEKKKKKKGVSPQFRSLFLASLQPFVWLLAHTWIRKNTDCFAVYSLLEFGIFTLKNSRFFFSKSAKKSVKRGVRVVCSFFSLVPDLLFDCLRVLEYVKIRTVLQFSRLGSGCLLGNRIVLV